MGKAQKIFMVTLWGALVLAMVAVIGAGVADRWRRKPVDLPVIFPAPAFSLTDQDGKPFTDKQLAGRPWISDFVFTQCAGPCPLMTSAMARLQTAVHDSSVRFVTVSVDPTHDTPAVLKAYGAKFGAKQPRWCFLTTSKPEDIYALANGLHLSAQPATAQDPPMHAEYFLLIDGQRQVRGIYHMDDPESMKKLARDADLLAADSAAGKAP